MIFSVTHHSHSALADEALALSRSREALAPRAVTDGRVSAQDAADSIRAAQAVAALFRAIADHRDLPDAFDWRDAFGASADEMRRTIAVACTRAGDRASARPDDAACADQSAALNAIAHELRPFRTGNITPKIALIHALNQQHRANQRHQSTTG